MSLGEWLKDFWNGEPHFKAYSYKKGPDTIQFEGRKVARTYEVGNWDVARERVLYLRPDGTYTLKESIHDIGVVSDYTHNMSESDVKKVSSSLARQAGFGKVVKI